MDVTTIPVRIFMKFCMGFMPYVTGWVSVLFLATDNNNIAVESFVRAIAHDPVLLAVTNLI
jgi:hypothetical protein